MNPSPEQIERTLRAAPCPPPPAGLRQKLIHQLPTGDNHATSASAQLPALPWFRRWRLALATGSVAIVSLVALGVQQARIQELRATIDRLQEKVQRAAPAPTPVGPPTPSAAQPAPAETGAAEIERLRATVARLTTEIATTEAVAAENARLKAAEAASPAVTAEELEALTDAKEKAKTIACINNMKQLGLAVRVWATDNGDVFAPDTQSLSNEIGSLKVLICPSDEGRQVAVSWPELAAANVSYEYLAPSAGDDEPQRVMFRCPIHGNITLSDGSVQQGLAKTHPERFRTIDGKLYLDEAPARPPQ